jgi:D-proline reductase (dithiol) PrdB
VNLRWKNRMLAKIYRALPGLAARWGKKSPVSGGDVPWARPTKDLRHATVALVTTGGVHLKTDRPFDMSDPDGDPTWREIPLDAPASALVITHDYYDHTDADRDLNLVLPAERLKEMEQRGVIGRLHPAAYSFMGHIDGRHVEELIFRYAPEVARKLTRAGVDYALLVPS